MSVSSVASGIETVFSGFGGLKILRNCSWHLFSRSSARDKTLPFPSLTDMFPLLYKTLSVFLTIYSVLRSCPASASSAFSARFSIYSFLSHLTIVFTSLSRFGIFFCSALSLSRSLSISCGYVARNSSVFKFKSSHDESFFRVASIPSTFLILSISLPYPDPVHYVSLHLGYELRHPAGLMPGAYIPGANSHLLL